MVTLLPLRNQILYTDEGLIDDGYSSNLIGWLNHQLSKNINSAIVPAQYVLKTNSVNPDRIKIRPVFLIYGKYESYVNFLKQYNVIDFYGLDYSYCINYEVKKLPLEMILGFSEKAGEDLIAFNEKFLNRVSKGYLAIAKIKHGNLFFCIFYA